MKNRTLILTLSAVAVLALGAVSFAGPGRGHGYGMGPGMMGSGLGANLSDEQRTALDKAHDEFVARTESLRNDLNTKDLELQAELSKAAPEQARVTALTKDINALRGKLFEEQTAFRATLAKDFGLRNGQGHGRGMGYGRGMGQGMTGRGFGPGACPNWSGADADDRTN